MINKRLVKVLSRNTTITYKLVLLVLLAVGVYSCKQAPQLKKYYLVVYQDEKDLVTDRFQPKEKIDSVLVETDSMAYWKGVFAASGSLITEKKMQAMRVEQFFKYKDFDVWDEYKVSILPRITPSNKEKGEAFVRQKLAETR